MLLTLGPERGSPLWRAPNEGLTLEIIKGDLSNVAGILGDRFFSRWPFNLREIRSPLAFMVINLGKSPVKFRLSSQMSEEQVLWDPYVFEHAVPSEINPDNFKRDETPIPVPEGFESSLPKWYSVKYSYPNHNLIFIRPQLGISFQTHAQRGEDWEIMAGSPIIVAGSRVAFDAKVGTHFELPLGSVHGIINPAKDQWAAIKETWSGHFDEQDITRVFNPNHYIDPNVK